MSIYTLRKLAAAAAVALAGFGAAGATHAAPAKFSPPPKYKIKQAKTAALVCNPHKVLNILVVRNLNAKTFPKGAKIFYLAQKPGGGIVAQGWHTLKKALLPGARVGIRYGSWPLPRSRKASYCRTYIKYYE